MPTSFDPPESHPLPCARCERTICDIDGMCALCAISAAADSDSFERCFSVAEDFGIPVVLVGRLIASSAAYRARAEGINAQRALLNRLTSQTAVTGLLAGLRIEASNDTSTETVSK
jgi:hypothetical protein